MYVDSIVASEVQTHELRINAPISDTMSLTAGVFMNTPAVRLIVSLIGALILSS